MSRSVEVEIVEELSEDEQRERLHLERKVERAVFDGDRALQELRDRKLYRSTHSSFEQYCRDRFGFSRDSAYLKIRASQVYDNITNYLPTNERQLRSIAKAKLEPEAEAQAWVDAVDEADGKLPSGRIVKDIVQRIRQRNPVPNPFQAGEVCQIIARDNPELRGKGGCWCIVSEVQQWSCAISTWDAEYVVRVEYLKSCNYSLEERQQMEELGIRMTQLYETGTLDQGALWVLKGLEKLHRPYLTSIEEKLLALLEQEYGITAS